MNKAFEKILDRLDDAGGCDSFSEYANGWDSAIEESISIVQKVAEEYNGGWIPCSERLPEKYTVLCCDRYGEILVGHPYFDEVSDTNYSAESENEMMYNCVAWQPLPEPYKESD